MSSDLKLRTKSFALRIIKLTARFPQRFETRHIMAQILRCSSSVAANYRASRRAKSRADFIAKLAIVEEEADESLFWLELMEEVSLALKISLCPEVIHEMKLLKNEANQLVSIIVAAKKTARASS
jgi:four helix bundle protein